MTPSYDELYNEPPVMNGIDCEECGEIYPLDYWQRFKGGLGPTTDFVCEECEYIKGVKTEHHLLDHYAFKSN